MPSGSFHDLHCRAEWLWNLHTQLCLDRCLLPEPLFKEASMSRPSVLLLIAWLLAVSATGGALFIGEVMGMAPCVLCWYQRIAMFPLALLLGMAFYSDDRRGAVYALPLALAGAAVAGYHSLLVAGLVPKAWVPCGAGVSCADQKLDILYGIELPWLSLVAFIAIAVSLSLFLRKTDK